MTDETFNKLVDLNIKNPKIVSYETLFGTANSYHKKQLEIAHRLKDSTDITFKERSESIFKHYENLSGPALMKIFYSDMEHIMEYFCQVIQDFISDISDKIKYNLAEYVRPSEYFRIMCSVYAKERMYFEYAKFINYNEIKNSLHSPSILKFFDFDSEYGEHDTKSINHLIMDFFIGQASNINPIKGLDIDSYKKLTAIYEDNWEYLIPIDKYIITPPILKTLMFFGLRILDLFNSKEFCEAFNKNTLRLNIPLNPLRLIIGMYVLRKPYNVTSTTEDFIRETYKCREIYKEMVDCFEQISLCRKSSLNES